jgi:hypothetical protein
MVARKDENAPRGHRVKIDRLRVKRETVKDLDVTEQKGIKGGSGSVCMPTVGCPSGGPISRFSC